MPVSHSLIVKLGGSLARAHSYYLQLANMSCTGRHRHAFTKMQDIHYNCVRYLNMDNRSYDREFWCTSDTVKAMSMAKLRSVIPREEGDPVLSMRGATPRMIQYSPGFAFPTIFFYPCTLIPWQWYMSWFIEWGITRDSTRESCKDYFNECPDSVSSYSRAMIGVDLAGYAARRSVGLTQMTKYRSLLDYLTGEIGKRAHTYQDQYFQNVLDMRPIERPDDDGNL